MATSAPSRLSLPSVASRALIGVQLEDLFLAALLLLALLARLVGLPSVEPNILADEADRLLQLYRIQAGSGPGPFGVAADGVAGGGLYPPLLFVALLGGSFLGLRLATAFASLLAITVFYLLARRSLSPFAAGGATILFAFSGWLLFFSRHGLLEIWVVLYQLAAAYAAQLALETNRRRHWLLAGLFCGLGWYAELGGWLILPSLLLYLLVAALLDRRLREKAQQGAVLVNLVAFVLLLPRLPAIGEHWTLVEQQLRTRTAAAGAGDTSGSLVNGLATTVRALVLLDPSLPSSTRSLAPGAAVLDSFSGTLYFVGLLLGLRCLGRTALWWCLLLPAFLLHAISRGIPDAGRALPALPAMMLFGGLTIDWLIRARHVGELARFGLLVALPIAAWWNVGSYVEWQRRPSNAAARQPAIELAEFPVWRQVQQEEIAAGRPGFTVTQWHGQRDRYQEALAAAAAASAAPAGSRFASELEARPLAGFGTVPNLKKPRGVAADATGAFYVLDGDGRVLSLDLTGRVVATFGPGGGGPSAEEVSDLALLPDGSLLVLDAGRGQVDRYDPSGRFMATISNGWGMFRPRGLAVGPDGTIYVADTGKNRVVVSTGGPPTREIKDLEQPTDVAVDGRGWAYVALPEASKLAVFDADGRQQTTWDIPRTNTVEGPHLAFLEIGALAITEPAKRRVVFTDPSGKELAQVGGENDQTFGLPYAVAAAGGRLIVSDSAKAAVRAFELTAR